MTPYPYRYSDQAIKWQHKNETTNKEEMHAICEKCGTQASMNYDSSTLLDAETKA